MGMLLISTEVKSLSVEGKELMDEEYNALMYKIFIETGVNQSLKDNSTESSVSQTDLKKA